MSVFSIIVLVVIGTTIWVGFDASKREWKNGGTASWVIGCILLWIVVFPWYLTVRNKTPLKGEEETYAGAHAANPYDLPAGAMYRECPHCKEPMRRDATLCPHCRTGAVPWRFFEGRWWYRETPDDAWEYLDEQTGEWRAIQPVCTPLE